MCTLPLFFFVNFRSVASSQTWLLSNNFFHLLIGGWGLSIQSTDVKLSERPFGTYFKLGQQPSRPMCILFIVLPPMLWSLSWQTSESKSILTLKAFAIVSSTAFFERPWQRIKNDIMMWKKYFQITITTRNSLLLGILWSLWSFVLFCLCICILWSCSHLLGTLWSCRSGLLSSTVSLVERTWKSTEQ